MAAALALIVAGLFGGTTSAQDRPGNEFEPEALVVPIAGPVGVTTVALIRRAVREADSLGVRWVVLEIDTPGGYVESMREIESAISSLRGGRVSTVSFVRRHALSAGAYIALASEKTYMATGATMGAVTPVVLGPQGTMNIPDDDVRSKLISATRAEIRALVERRADRRGGGDEAAPLLAEAMVDPDLRVFEVVYDEGGADVQRVVSADDLRALENRGVTIRHQQQIGSQPLTLTNVEAVRYGFSDGTFDSLDELYREALSVDPRRVVRVEPSWSESTVDWLEMVKPLLFLFGFILLLLEVKTPGFAVPGALGLLLIGIGLASSYMVGLADWTEILLFVIGVGLVCVEIFVVPGTIISGVVGFLCIVAALVFSQQSFIVPENGTQWGVLEDNIIDLIKLILMVMVGTFCMYRFLPRIPVLNRVLLQPTAERHTGDATQRAEVLLAATDSGAAVVGAVGRAATDLRPSGLMELEGADRLDVVAEGGFIELGSPIEILEISGNRVVVGRVEPAPNGGGSPEAGAASMGLLVLLVVIGLCLVVAEVFFVSMGILSVMSAIALVSAVFLAFTEHGQAVGYFFLAGCSVGVPLCIYYAMKVLPRTGIGQSILLAGPEHAGVTRAAADPRLDELAGQSGEAVSDLRPAGYARIGGRRVDVVTRGEMIERGARVTVIAVDSNRVVVKATAPEASGPPES